MYLRHFHWNRFWSNNNNKLLCHISWKFTGGPVHKHMHVISQPCGFPSVIAWPWSKEDRTGNRVVLFLECTIFIERTQWGIKTRGNVFWYEGKELVSHLYTVVVMCCVWHRQESCKSGFSSSMQKYEITFYTKDSVKRVLTCTTDAHHMRRVSSWAGTDR